MSDSIFIIDGSALLYRAYYAIKPLHTSSGIPVQATFGFCRALKRLIDDFNPRYLVIAWDSSGPTFRRQEYAAYKVTRQAAPTDLHRQREYIQEIAQLMGIAQIERAGYEADDLIASLVAEHPDKSVVIVSPDKDLQQLISDRVEVYDPFKKETITRNSFIKNNEFEPSSLLLYHALLGDASDNIPGVTGIGKKGAQDLAATYGTLANLYANIELVTSDRLKKPLLAQEHNARLSEKLFTLAHIATGLSLEDISFDPAWCAGAIPLLQSLDFKTLIPAFGGAAPKAAPDHSWECHIIDTQHDLAELAERVRAAGVCAIDTETSGLRPLTDSLVGISIAYSRECAYYIPVGHTVSGTTQLSPDEVRQILAPLFADMSISKILHHAKFDQLVLWNAGMPVRNVVFDTVLAAHLVRDSWEKIGLKGLSQHYLHEGMRTFKEVVGTQYKTFAEVPLEEGARYAAHDALQTFKIEPYVRAELAEQPALQKLFFDVEMPISQILYQMELTGILLDAQLLAQAGILVEKELSGIEEKMYAIIRALPANHLEQVINFNSPKQVEKLLFDTLGLPVIKYGAKGSRSTDQEVLEKLSAHHPLPALLVRYRELSKLLGTYIQPLPKQINPKTGRIHTTFNQTEVVTGRLSSSDPNLQNIPTSAGHGMAIRAAFIAGPGALFVDADYSQIELRILAHLSGDHALIAAFTSGKDIHAQTAAEIFGVAIGEVTSEQRQMGKRVNFGIMYGLTPYGLSRDLGISPREAKTYIEKYFTLYKGVADWIERTIAQASECGYVTTMLGRRRAVPQLREKNRVLHDVGRRIAINTPVQGTAAELIKLAMIAFDRTLAEHTLRARMILQIHDELLIECPQEELVQVQALVRESMMSVVSWEVPLEVAIRVGGNWAEVSK